MQAKLVLLAGFSLICLVANLVTTANARTGSAQTAKVSDAMAVAGPTDSVVFRDGADVYVYDATYRTLYHVETNTRIDNAGHDVITTKLH